MAPPFAPKRLLAFERKPMVRLPQHKGKLMLRTTILSFGPHGDVTIHWEDQNDGKVLPVIQKMIDSGVRFFVLKKKLLKDSKHEVKTVDQALSSRKIVIPDEALEQLHQAGLITTSTGQIIENSVGEVENTGQIAKTAEQVAANPTVAVAPARGG